MKSIVLLVLAITVMVTSSSGQNLVQNSSFNMNTLVLPCENDLDWNGITIAARIPMNKIQNWSQPSLSSTDYFHECAQGPNPTLYGAPWFDVPYNSYATGTINRKALRFLENLGHTLVYMHLTGITQHPCFDTESTVRSD